VLEKNKRFILSQIQKETEALIIENRFSLILDFKQSSFYNIKFVQNDIDTSVLEFTICNQGVPVDITDQTISFAFLKSDNTLVIQDFNTGVSILDAINGKLQVILKSQSLSAVGLVKTEISFSDATGKKLSTAQFNFTVTSSLDNGDGVLSSNAIPVMEAQIVVWNSEIDNKLAEATNKINETEVTRQLAITAKENADIATANTIDAMEDVNNTVITINNETLVIYKGVVTSYSNIASTFPTPQNGWTVVTTDTGNRYRYSSTSLSWVNIGDIGKGGIVVGSNVPSDTSVIFIDINS